MAIVMRRNGESRHIALSGAIDIGAAHELKTALVETLNSGEKVEVTLSAVTDLDLTACQLLFAAKWEAERRGRELAFVGTPEERVRGTLASLGLSGRVFPE